MATTLTLSCSSSAWCPGNDPGTNYHGAQKYTLAGEGAKAYYTYLLCNFQQLSSSYQYRPIISATFHVTLDRSISSSTYTGQVSFQPLRDRFNASTVTQNNMPLASGTILYGGAMTTAGGGDLSLSYTVKTKDGDRVEAAKALLTTCSAEIYHSMALTGTNYVRAYTNAADSAKRPYLEVVLGDSPAIVTPVMTSPSSITRFDRSKEIKFTWNLQASGTAIAPIVQTSATFYWREKGSTGNYNSRTVSGDVRSITIPANTFPGRDIEYYVMPAVTGYTAARSSGSSAMPRIFVDMNPTGIAGIKKFAPDSTIPWTGHYQLAYTTTTAMRDNLLAEFGTFPSSRQYKAIDQSGINISTSAAALTHHGVELFFLKSNFDAGTVTWNTCPEYGQFHNGNRTYNNETESHQKVDDFLIQASYFDGLVPASTTRDKSRLAAEMITNPAFMLRAGLGTKTVDSYYFYVWDPVTLRAILIDQTVTSKPEAVTNVSGYVNPHIAQTFSWEHVPDGDYWCVGTWTTASATFQYKLSSASTWTSVSATSGSSEVTLAADTLSAGTYQWRVTATDSAGTTATSDIYTINTQDGAHTATPITPNGSLENADAKIRFIWSDASETGAAPAGADLQYSVDNGVTWTTFGQPRNANLYYDAAANTFSSGAVSWRVRSRNAENTAGAWSSPLSFLAFAAPAAPIVSADGKPLLTVTWQSAEQQAYEVTVDGIKYGPYFGTAKTWQAPDYLSNGSHSVAVRVQNEYGLWSQPGTITVTVTNAPGTTITLKGTFDRDAELYWNGSGSNFLIYRDGVLIGHTSARTFTDRTSLGYHSWKIVQRLSNGYYTPSTTVNGELTTACPAIAALDGGGWIDLKLSANSDRSMTWNHNQNVTVRQFAGREYPDIEVSPYRSTSVSFDVAWSYREAEQAAAFADLVGRPVILKTPCEGVLVGILSAWQRENTQFYKAYSCTIQKINWRDYTDADS